MANNANTPRRFWSKSKLRRNWCSRSRDYQKASNWRRTTTKPRWTGNRRKTTQRLTSFRVKSKKRNQSTIIGIANLPCRKMMSNRKVSEILTMRPSSTRQKWPRKMTSSSKSKSKTERSTTISTKRNRRNWKSLKNEFKSFFISRTIAAKSWKTSKNTRKAKKKENSRDFKTCSRGWSM